MKRLLIVTVIAVAGIAQAALAANVGVDIHIGTPLAVVPVPVAVPAPAPAPPPPPVVIEEPPLFLYPPELGFGIAVGLPYDVFFISGSYYLYQGNAWYRAPYYNGPWVVTGYRSLPPGLHRHRFERIHYYRDREYRAYRHGHDHYRGRHYRPEKRYREERKHQRKEEHQRWKEEKKEQKHDKGNGKHGNHD